MQWNPRRLPRVRQQMTRFMNDPTTMLYEVFPEHRTEFAALARQLPVAELYWVMSDMAALAVSSGQELPDVRWTTDDRPSGIGLLVFEDGIGSVQFQGAVVPADALSWGPAPGGMRLWHWVRRSRIEEALGHSGAQLAAWMPPLIPAHGTILPVSAEPTPTGELDESVRTLMTTLAAAWHMMEQPRLVDRSQVEPDRKERRSLARAGDSSPGVTLVDLRRQYVPQVQDDEPEGGKRQYRHRFVVSGHWRDQAHGPDRSLRRRTWITSYLKGPDGAPLLDTTRVNVWKR